MTGTRHVRLELSSRRGFTLIEVLIVVTAVSALLALCAVTIQLLFRLSSDSQSRLSAAMALERLARQFRADVHGSERARLGGDDKSPAQPPVLRLAMDTGHEVTYSPRAESVVRTETRAGKPVRREEFTFGRSRTARFELRDDAPRRWVVLVLGLGQERNRADSPRPVEVLALQGKDRALVHGTKGDEKP
jgi:prepilin-type N-terminal cleavage/methylation domain-containing protein